jgi:multiple sugar transport system permease protein
MTAIHLKKELGKTTTIFHRHLTIREREGIIGLLFILPWILGFLLLKLGPILAALGFSFTDFYMIEPDKIHFIGLKNYLSVLADPGAGSSMFGSIKYFVLTVPLELMLALGLAAIFSSKRLRGKRLLRTLFFMTCIIPAGVVTYIWTGLTSPSNGWLAELFFRPLGLPMTNGGSNLFIMMMAIWGIGPGFLIMLGAMQGVPQELYEAARVDGAGPLTRFLTITIPIISPAIFFSLVIDLTSAFGGSTLLDRGYLFRQSPSPMEGLISRTMFTSFQLGYASTLAWFMFVVTMAITLVLFQQARRRVYFPEETKNEDI